VTARDFVRRKRYGQYLIERDEPEQTAIAFEIAQQGEVEQRHDREFTARDRRDRRILDRNIEKRREQRLEEEGEDRDPAVDEGTDDERDADDAFEH